MADTLRRFLLRDAPVRGEVVSLDGAWREVVRRHEGLPACVCNRLGELTAAALLLAATLKFDGKLILQIHGDGPVALFVVECDAGGSFRSTVKLRDGVTVPDTADLEELVNAQGGGRFVVTLDPQQRSGSRQPYQGIVPFEGGSVAAALERYMLRSEQLPTRLWLAADGHRATGLLLQRLPDEGGAATAQPVDADAWDRVGHLAATLTAEELLQIDDRQLLTRLFWQEKLHGFDERRCAFACSCSRQKVAAMLQMLGRDEIEAILADTGSIEVRCEFCNLPYTFDPVDSAGLFIEGVAPPSSTSRH